MENPEALLDALSMETFRQRFGVNSNDSQLYQDNGFQFPDEHDQLEDIVRDLCIDDSISWCFADSETVLKDSYDFKAWLPSPQKDAMRFYDLDDIPKTINGFQVSNTNKASLGNTDTNCNAFTETKPKGILKQVRRSGIGKHEDSGTGIACKSDRPTEKHKSFSSLTNNFSTEITGSNSVSQGSKGGMVIKQIDMTLYPEKGSCGIHQYKAEMGHASLLSPQSSGSCNSNRDIRAKEDASKIKEEDRTKEHVQNNDILTMPDWSCTQSLSPAVSQTHNTGSHQKKTVLQRLTRFGKKKNQSQSNGKTRTVLSEDKSQTCPPTKQIIPILNESNANSFDWDISQDLNFDDRKTAPWYETEEDDKIVISDSRLKNHTVTITAVIEESARVLTPESDASSVHLSDKNVKPTNESISKMALTDNIDGGLLSADNSEICSIQEDSQCLDMYNISKESRVYNGDCFEIADESQRASDVQDHIYANYHPPNIRKNIPKLASAFIDNSPKQSTFQEGKADLVVSESVTEETNVLTSSSNPDNSTQSTSGLVKEYIENDDVDSLKEIVTNYREPQCTDGRGCNTKALTPFHWAIQLGRLECLQALLQSQPLMEQCAWNKGLVLELAAVAVKANQVKCLLLLHHMMGFEVMTGPVDSEGNTLMHLAGSLNHTDIIDALNSLGYGVSVEKQATVIPPELSLQHTAISANMSSSRKDDPISILETPNEDSKPNHDDHLSTTKDNNFLDKEENTVLSTRDSCEEQITVGPDLQKGKVQLSSSETCGHTPLIEIYDDSSVAAEEILRPLARDAVCSHGEISSVHDVKMNESNSNTDLEETNTTIASVSGNDLNSCVNPGVQLMAMNLILQELLQCMSKLQEDNQWLQTSLEDVKRKAETTMKNLSSHLQQRPGLQQQDGDTLTDKSIDQRAKHALSLAVSEMELVTSLLDHCLNQGHREQNLTSGLEDGRPDVVKGNNYKHEDFRDLLDDMCHGLNEAASPEAHIRQRILGYVRSLQKCRTESLKSNSNLHGQNDSHNHCDMSRPQSILTGNAEEKRAFDDRSSISSDSIKSSQFSVDGEKVSGALSFSVGRMNRDGNQSCQRHFSKQKGDSITRHVHRKCDILEIYDRGDPDTFCISSDELYSSQSESKAVVSKSSNCPSQIYNRDIISKEYSRAVTSLNRPIAEDIKERKFIGQNYKNNDIPRLDEDQVCRYRELNSQIPLLLTDISDTSRVHSEGNEGLRNSIDGENARRRKTRSGRWGGLSLLPHHLKKKIERLSQKGKRKVATNYSGSSNSSSSVITTTSSSNGGGRSELKFNCSVGTMVDYHNSRHDRHQWNHPRPPGNSKPLHVRRIGNDHLQSISCKTQSEMESQKPGHAIRQDATMLTMDETTEQRLSVIEQHAKGLESSRIWSSDDTWSSLTTVSEDSKLFNSINSSSVIDSGNDRVSATSGSWGLHQSRSHRSHRHHHHHHPHQIHRHRHRSSIQRENERYRHNSRFHHRRRRHEVNSVSPHRRPYRHSDKSSYDTGDADESDESDTSSDPSVRVNVDNEDWPDEMLRVQRLAKHLESVQRLQNGNQQVIETVIAGTGEVLTSQEDGSHEPSHVNIGEAYPFSSYDLKESQAIAKTKRTTSPSGPLGRLAKIHLFNHEKLRSGRCAKTSKINEPDASPTTSEKRCQEMDRDVPWELLTFSDSEDTESKSRNSTQENNSIIID